jgi:hypothetical protein
MRFNGTEVCVLIYLLPLAGYLLYRALRGMGIYRKVHTGFTPQQAFVTCHDLLERIVLRAWELLPAVEDLPATNWYRYTVSADGILSDPGEGRSAALIPITKWTDVSGVGLEMRPLYDYARATKSYWHVATRINVGYQFNILVVPFTGETVTVTLPLQDSAHALEFAAHLLAFARRRNCRLSVMGFDKEITKTVVHLQSF